MPRWDRPLDHPDSPYRRPLDLKEVPLRPSGRPVASESALWLFILKGLMLFFIGGLLLSNAMYGLFALLDLLGG